MDIKIAYYREKDWERFIYMIDDSENMHDTWREWHKDFKKAKNELMKEGFTVIDIVIDLDELSTYCMLRGLKNDGRTRSQFVQQK